MEDASTPSPDEYVLRRVSACNVKDRFPYGHFVPTDNDKDGLTLWQESVRTAESLVEGQRNKWGYYVSRFQVKELTAIGLQLRITENVAPGHVSITDCSIDAYSNNKASVTEKLKKLADLAWKNRILGPTKPLP